MINSSYSKSTKVKSGVPQGRALGPLLFLLFINDLPTYLSSLNALHSSHIKLFADDIKAYSIVNSLQQALSFQVLINSIEGWCCDWQLRINIGKSIIVHV